MTALPESDLTDLRNRSGWKLAPDPDSITSFCGRYLIRREVGADTGAARYLAWRCRRDERDRWAPPDLIGAFVEADHARSACHDHAERNP